MKKDIFNHEYSFLNTKPFILLTSLAHVPLSLSTILWFCIICKQHQAVQPIDNIYLGIKETVKSLVVNTSMVTQYIQSYRPALGHTFVGCCPLLAPWAQGTVGGIVDTWKAVSEGRTGLAQESWVQWIPSFQLICHHNLHRPSPETACLYSPLRPATGSSCNIRQCREELEPHWWFFLWIFFYMVQLIMCELR